ncbi:MAG: CoA transferase, partial [Gammaproteobacteria bacterium]|nr:CoA transferase [Gammaproteobacteria bacterium]
RRETGLGAFVELSLHEAGVSFHVDFLLDKQLGHDPKPIGNDHPAHAFSAVLRTQGEDEWIAVSCRTEAERVKFESIVRKGTKDFDKHELTTILQAAGIAAGPVNITPDFLADKQVEHRKFFVELTRVGHPNMTFPGSPIVIDGELDRSDWHTAPLLGEHNREVLTGWLGYDDHNVDRLLDEGVIAERPPA